MARRAFISGSVLAISIGTSVAWAAPPRPVAVSPGDAGTFSRVAQSCPTFSWGGVQEAEAYELVVFAVDDAVLEEGQLAIPRAPRLRVTLPGTAFSFTPSMDRCLEPGGRYAWFVRALGTGAEEWSQAKVFEVSSRPSIAEVEEALEVLRRYRGEERDEEPEGLPQDEGRAEADTVTASAARPAGLDRRQGPNGRAAASEAAERKTERPEPPPSRLGRIGGAAERGSAVVEQEALDFGSAGARAPAPTLGTPSLTVDQQVHLGAASSVFKDGELFLWSDGADGNTALGTRALSSTTTAEGSTALGWSALTANTYGRLNTAVGAAALESNTSGRYNTASGMAALRDNTTGDMNTASGTAALYHNTFGHWNTAIGSEVLRENTYGSWNTAIGAYALLLNRTGDRNTAVGAVALNSNPSSDNTAVGYQALRYNAGHPVYGSSNTALGTWALHLNDTGDHNTASGVAALRFNTTGYYNTASGFEALRDNTTGYSNTASGVVALASNTTGSHNTALGRNALLSNTTGSRNVAIGWDAGRNATTGDDNIFISHLGVAGEGHTIRIGGGTGSGNQQQNRTFIAGIRGITTGNANAVTVVIDPAGQLGTVSSSRRYKEEIHDMAEASAGLLELRPVTFRYKPEVAGEDRPLQFGLIAEEVAELYPELVAFGEDGQPEAVLDRFLSPLLLNEVQKQHARIEAQAAELAAQAKRLAAQEREILALRAQSSRLERLEARLKAMAADRERRFERQR